MYINYDDFIMCHDAFYYFENSDLGIYDIAAVIFNFMIERTLTIHPDTTLRATHVTLERNLTKYKKLTNNPSWLMVKHFSYQHFNEIIQPNKWMLQYINEDEKFTNNFFRDDYLEGTELDENPNNDPVDRLEFEDVHVIRINDYLSPYRSVFFDWPTVFNMTDEEIDKRVKQKELTGIAIDWYRKNNRPWFDMKKNTFMIETSKTYNAICIACEEAFQYICQILTQFRVNEKKFNEGIVQIDKISEFIIEDWKNPNVVRPTSRDEVLTHFEEEDPIYNEFTYRLGLVKVRKRNKIKISPTKHPTDSSGTKKILECTDEDEEDRKFIAKHTEGTVHQFLPIDARHLNETKFNKSSFLPKRQ